MRNPFAGLFSRANAAPIRAGDRMPCTAPGCDAPALRLALEAAHDALRAYALGHKPRALASKAADACERALWTGK